MIAPLDRGGDGVERRVTAGRAGMEAIGNGGALLHWKR